MDECNMVEHRPGWQVSMRVNGNCKYQVETKKS